MSFGMEECLKPILLEMGLYEGKEVSVKEAYDRYIKACPKGIGPLWKFKTIASSKLEIGTKEVKDGSNYDLFFTCPRYMLKRQELLNYDPRYCQCRQAQEVT